MADLPLVRPEEEADRCRKHAKEKVDEEDYTGALCYLNISLLCAKSAENKELLALAYGNRAHVYLKIRQYDKCLQNIEWARMNEFPAEKLHKLDECERQCREMMQQQDSADDPYSFFKLSHPANESIPFIVNCLEIHEDGKRGHGIFTSKDLKAGDVIALEPIFDGLAIALYHCENCFKQNMMNLIPGYDQQMFCSNACFEEHARLTELYGDLPRDVLFNTTRKALSICGGYEELNAIYFDTTRRTVFDYDFSDPNDEEINLKKFRCAASLRKTKINTKEILEKLMPEFQKYALLLKSVKLPSHHEAILNKFFRRSLEISSYNALPLKFSYALLIFLPLINHSCDPNIDVVCVDGHYAAIVNRPLKAGDQLYKTFNYFEILKCTFDDCLKRTRQQEVMKKYQYLCECSACAGNYPLEMRLPHRDPDFKMPSRSLGSFKETKEELVQNWNYLNANMERHPSVETSVLLGRNRDLLDRMQKLVCLSSCNTYSI